MTSGVAQSRELLWFTHEFTIHESSFQANPPTPTVHAHSKLARMQRYPMAATQQAMS